MFNLNNLNDYEFEILALDIMEVILNKKLYRFSKGKDGGIDICDNQKNPKVIIQVKHYINSKYSNLKQQLKKEIDKIKKYNINDYYVFTSLKLTRANKIELFNLLTPYIKNIDNIIDGETIDDFLEKKENIDIVNKNYKLWLNSTNVLSLIQNRDVFIDCETLMFDIEEKVSNFVETECYKESYKKLKRENIIIITGAPGVGKSTISKMLLLKFASEGYVVRYVSNNDISKIKSVLSNDMEKKEIILLDDFLGQHYLNLTESKPHELKSLLSFIKKNKNKKIILNSRITILQEAQRQYIEFDELMERYDENKYLINLNKMSLIEKAKILYNHIYFNNIPKEYFDSLKKDENYFYIINHRNYNPRIIEYVTKKRILKEIVPDNYFNYIIEKLNNPQDVWKDEFDNRLQPEDRMLIYALYTLTDNYIDFNILKEVYVEYLKYIDGIDITINHFDIVMKRLLNSLVVKVKKDNKIMIGVINPSVNDYVKNELNSNNNLLMTLIKKVNYIEQIYKFIDKKEIVNILINKIEDNTFFEIKTLKKSVYYYCIDIIIKNMIKKNEIVDNVKRAFENSYKNINGYVDILEYRDLIFSLCKNTDIIKFYYLSEVVKKKCFFEKIINRLSYKELVLFLETFDDNYYDDKEFADVIREHAIECIENEIIFEIENSDLSGIIERNIIDYDEIQNSSLKSDIIFRDRVIEETIECIENDILDKISKFKNYIEINEDEISINNIMSNINVEDDIAIFIDSFYDEMIHDEEESEDFDEIKFIKIMFNR